MDTRRRCWRALVGVLCTCAGGLALSLVAPGVGNAQEEPDGGVFLSPVELRRSLPQPVLGADRDWLALYWAAWDIANGHVQKGSAENGFVDLYMGPPTGANPSQFDACLTMMYARYGHAVFPSIVSLDNFYRKQHPDGFICRELSSETGQDRWEKTDPDAIHPPLLAWAELEHYRLTADKARLSRILPILDRHFQWLKSNRRRANGLYWTSSVGSGMDNSPRGGTAHCWVDLSAQQALSARCLAEIAREVGDNQLAGQYDREYADLGKLINQLCWDRQDNIYYDLDAQGQFVRVKTVASFWPLLAGVADKKKAASLVGHLLNPAEFWQPHVFPSLSADHPDYDPSGGNWRGAVFPPLDYAIVKGLEQVGEEDLAAKVAANHLANMAEVFRQTDDIYDSYAPAMPAPGSEATGSFVGWSGCGPIALLLENVIGLRVDAPNNAVRWRLRRTDRHGVRALRFGSNSISLICDSRTFPEDTCRIAATAQDAFNLEVETTWTKVSKRIRPGKQVFEIKGKKRPKPPPETVGG